jgi:hypothetical protein
VLVVSPTFPPHAHLTTQKRCDRKQRLHLQHLNDKSYGQDEHMNRPYSALPFPRQLSIFMEMGLLVLIVDEVAGCCLLLTLCSTSAYCSENASVSRNRKEI